MKVLPRLSLGLHSSGAVRLTYKTQSKWKAHAMGTQKVSVPLAFRGWQQRRSSRPFGAVKANTVWKSTLPDDGAYEKRS